MLFAFGCNFFSRNNLPQFLLVRLIPWLPEKEEVLRFVNHADGGMLDTVEESCFDHGVVYHVVEDN